VQRRRGSSTAASSTPTVGRDEDPEPGLLFANHGRCKARGRWKAVRGRSQSARHAVRRHTTARERIELDVRLSQSVVGALDRRLPHKFHEGQLSLFRRSSDPRHLVIEEGDADSPHHLIQSRRDIGLGPRSRSRGARGSRSSASEGARDHAPGVEYIPKTGVLSHGGRDAACGAGRRRRKRLTIHAITRMACTAFRDTRTLRTRERCGVP
jgi:hypothetical protein